MYNMFRNPSLPSNYACFAVISVNGKTVKSNKMKWIRN